MTPAARRGTGPLHARSAYTDVPGPKTRLLPSEKPPLGAGSNMADPAGLDRTKETGEGSGLLNTGGGMALSV